MNLIMAASGQRTRQRLTRLGSARLPFPRRSRARLRLTQGHPRASLGTLRCGFQLARYRAPDERYFLANISRAQKAGRSSSLSRPCEPTRTMASHDREEKSFQAKDGTMIYYDHFAIRSPRKEGETNSLLLIHGWCAHPFPSSLPSSSFDERGDSAD